MNEADFLALVHEFADAQCAVAHGDDEEHLDVLNEKIVAEIKRLHARINQLDTFVVGAELERRRADKAEDENAALRQALCLSAAIDLPGIPDCSGPSFDAMPVSEKTA